MENKPIKRHEALRPLSREHHHGLLLCWKIREGFKRNVATARIKQYANWFWANHLQSHFEEEEKFVFVVLPKDNELLKRAIAEHHSIAQLFNQEEDVVNALNAIAEELEQHIRFEERILFSEIQQMASQAQLDAIAQHHHDVLCDDWNDEFWKD